jgi:CubicO group peptidase (beta-lactamase class C family)
MDESYHNAIEVDHVIPGCCDLPRLMDEVLVPSAAIAIIRDSRLAEVVSCGDRHTPNQLSVDEDIVFDAASLSKPVFAQVVLQLLDQGRVAAPSPE